MQIQFQLGTALQITYVYSSLQHYQFTKIIISIKCSGSPSLFQFFRQLHVNPFTIVPILLTRFRVYLNRAKKANSDGLKNHKVLIFTYIFHYFKSYSLPLYIVNLGEGLFSSN